MLDDLLMPLPVGARVLVVANLLLHDVASSASERSAADVAKAVASWDGPGAVVLAGNLFDLPSPPPGPEAVERSLAAHPALCEALVSFASGAGRQVVVLPGRHDWWLPHSPLGAAVLGCLSGARLAKAVMVEFSTGGGARLVRIEAGAAPYFEGGTSSTGGAPWAPAPPSPTPTSALSEAPQVRPLPPATVSDPPATVDAQTAVAARPAYERLGYVVPGLWRGSTSGWLAGIELVQGSAAASRFVASRLVYRQLGRRAWLLVLPMLVALGVRLPVAVLRPARHIFGALMTTAIVTGALELLVVAALAAVSLRQVWLAFSGQAGGPQDVNEPERAHARQLVAEGLAGLVTASSGRPELTLAGKGFYANPGSCSPVVREYAPRLGGLGLPAPFLTSHEVAWVELEAGHELHTRLLYGHALAPGATRAELAIASGLDRSRGARSADVPAPVLVASFPHGQQWPTPMSQATPDQWTRRFAALFVAAAGLLSLLAALAGPVADRLRALSRLVPLAVPQAAGALAALGGIALVILALGVRRGQRRAYLVCEATLFAVAMAHLVRGALVAPAVVDLVVAGFLWSRRRCFRASSDLPPVRRAPVLLAGTAITAMLVGATTLEGSSWIVTTVRHRVFYKIGWAQAFLATVERMADVQHVPLPQDVNGFFTPAMFATTAGLVLVASWMVFRPVVARNVQPGAGLERAREVVRRHGSGTLDYFALRTDKQFYFWRGSVVAYAVYGGVCLVSPDPIGPLAEREQAWRAFAEHVGLHGWSLAVLGAGEEWLPIYRATGMHDLYVGDEAVVRLQGFSLDGGRFKGLRQAVKRVARYGYSISFHDPADVPPALAAELEDVMTGSRRGGVERGFSMTLGRIFDKADRGLLIAVVHAPSQVPSGRPGRAVAFCQYVPAPGVKGFSLDLMRRDNGEHPNGLIDFAIVETIAYLARQGYEGLGLNFATMRAVLAGETGDGLSQKVQAWLVRRMSGPMQIESLWRFNAKFDPQWQPRYAVYASAESALPAALAVARAESFWELPLIGRYLVPSGSTNPIGD